MSETKLVGCGRCGELLGRVHTESEGARMLREHMADCEIIS